jgi:hypothetical protein
MNIDKILFQIEIDYHKWLSVKIVYKYRIHLVFFFFFLSFVLFSTPNLHINTLDIRINQSKAIVYYNNKQKKVVYYFLFCFLLDFLYSTSSLYFFILFISSCLRIASCMLILNYRIQHELIP